MTDPGSHDERDREISELTDETKARHSVEGRLAYATVEALNELSKQVSRIEGWLIGKIDDYGSPRGGLIYTVSELRKGYKWIIALLSAIALAAISSAALQIAHAFFPALFPGGKS
jgi:hypothetical protein